jgi:drug/metabolite transporter (DMT)-like permease
VIFAFYSALMKKRPAMHPLSFLAFSMGWGTFWLIPVFIWEMSTGKKIPTDIFALVTIAYVAIFPSIIAYICYNRALELIGANRVATLYPLIVAFGAVFAIVLLGERPQLYHVVGCALVLAGAFIATRKDRVASVEHG